MPPLKSIFSPGSGLHHPAVARRLAIAVTLCATGFLAACYESAEPPLGNQMGEDRPAEERVIRHVFIVAMENTDADALYGDTARAPYFNDTLMTRYAHAVNFFDVLPIGVPSEPHYVWMEAGTNVFADQSFFGNGDPSAANSTASKAHLANQIRLAANGSDWMSYQEGLNEATGACPIVSSGFYAAKHNPFVFFQTVAGNPPSKTNAYCAEHHRPLEALSADLAAGTVAAYSFITPDLCHDMHGDAGCDDDDAVRAGDDWLREHMPPLIAYAEENESVIFLVWDEGGATGRIPFVAIGPGVKAGYAGAQGYTHSSLVKSIERILGLPYLPAVASSRDVADLFKPGRFP